MKHLELEPLPSIPKRGYRADGASVAVVGATGAVGREMVDTLARRDFPVRSLRLLASSRSAGQALETPYGTVTVEDLASAPFAGVEIGLFSAGGAVSRVHAARAVAEGVVVIDNTSAFRMDPNVALVVPEVNAHTLPTGPAIIANPNCSTIQMVLALQPLHLSAGLVAVKVASYQSASGAGQKGIDELVAGSRAALAGDYPLSSQIHAKPLPFNVVPQIGAFAADDYTDEELKMVHETRKILGLPELRVAATCVRVPVLRGHSEVVHAAFRQPLEPDTARELLSRSPGIAVLDAPAEARYPTPVQAAHRFETYVGRMRRDLSEANGLVFWVVSDNLLKGAALNAVQIAEIVFAARGVAHV